MNRILELRQEHAKLVADMNDILTRAKDGLKGDDETTWEKMFARTQAITKELRMIESTEAVKAEAEKHAAKLSEDESATKRTGEVSYDQAFVEWMKRGVQDMRPEYRSALQVGYRAQAVGTGSAGGYTVPEGFSNQLEQALLAYGGIFEAADVIRTGSGNDIPWPLNDDTANAAVIIDENTAMTDQDTVFGVTTLKAFMYSSKWMKVSLQFMQDSFLNVEQFVNSTLATRIGRGFNPHATTGNGTTQPQGIVTASTLGKAGATGQTTTVTHDDLLDLIFSVDPAYRPMGRFMLNDLTWKAVMKMKDSTGRPLVWNDSGSLQDGIPTRLLGYGVTVNQSMPVMAASAKPILFGAMKNFKVRIVRDTTVVRAAERFVEFNQVGFVGLWRGDSRLIDAGTHPIKYYQNSAT